MWCKNMIFRSSRQRKYVMGYVIHRAGRYRKRHKKLIKLSRRKIQINPYGKTRLEAGLDPYKGELYGNITNRPIKNTKIGLEFGTKEGPSAFGEHEPIKGTKFSGFVGKHGIDLGVEQRITKNLSIKKGVAEIGTYTELKHKEKKIKFPI